MYYVKRSFILIISIIISIIIFLSISATLENIKLNIITNKFIKKGVYQENLSSVNQKIYFVFKDEFKKNNNYNISDNKIDFISTKIPAINLDIVGFYFGGHSAICIDNNNLIHITGFGNNKTVCYSNKNLWNIYDSYYGFRVNIDKKDYALDKLDSFLGQKYNYTFLFNTKNTKYCSDLVSQSFNKKNFYLNYHLFYTSVYDLMCNSNVFISFYCYKKNNVLYKYYLI